MSQRGTILKSIKARAIDLFGPQGEVEKIFRGVSRSAWQPGANTARPWATVVDDGQKVGEQYVDGSETQRDGSEDRTLNVKIVIDLEDNWGREETYETWTQRIEAICAAITNKLIPGVGCLRVRYISDEPFTVIFGDQSQEIWILEFEVDYFVDAPSPR